VPRPSPAVGRSSDHTAHLPRLCDANIIRLKVRGKEGIGSLSFFRHSGAAQPLIELLAKGKVAGIIGP
jgi:hypothetical protein